MGDYVNRFEDAFAERCGTRACVSVASGTAALHLALLAHGVSPGDEVIVPSLTYVATANCVRYMGAEPTFVDVDPNTWCIDPHRLEAAISPRTRGIIVVHLYGHPADMDAINAVASDHGLWVVEDAAEAFGARYKEQPTGGLASIGTFSFYGNKILTSGEGGALTVSDPELERRIRLFRGQGMDPNRRYFFPVVGYNYRLTNVACALLCAQLERADAMLGVRHRIFEIYREGLSGIPGIRLQPSADWAQAAPWLFCLTVDAQEFGMSRDDLMAFLQGEGIETRPFFIPIHQLPPYEAPRDAPVRLAVTEELSATGISLPTSSVLAEATAIRVVETIQAAGEP